MGTVLTCRLHSQSFASGVRVTGVRGGSAVSPGRITNGESITTRNFGVGPPGIEPGTP